MIDNRSMRRAIAASKRALGPKAEKVLISMRRVKEGPPPPWTAWNFDSILALLRSVGIDVEQIVNWTRAPNGTGFLIYYRGESITEAKQLLLL